MALTESSRTLLNVSAIHCTASAKPRPDSGNGGAAGITSAARTAAGVDPRSGTTTAALTPTTPAGDGDGDGPAGGDDEPDVLGLGRTDAVADARADRDAPAPRSPPTVPPEAPGAPGSDTTGTKPVAAALAEAAGPGAARLPLGGAWCTAWKTTRARAPPPIADHAAVNPRGGLLTGRRPEAPARPEAPPTRSSPLPAAMSTAAVPPPPTRVRPCPCRARPPTAGRHSRAGPGADRSPNGRGRTRVAVPGCLHPPHPSRSVVAGTVRRAYFACPSAAERCASTASAIWS